MERNRYGSAEGVVLAVIWVLWMEINSRIFYVFKDLIKRVESENFFGLRFLRLSKIIFPLHFEGQSC